MTIVAERAGAASIATLGLCVLVAPSLRGPRHVEVMRIGYVERGSLSHGRFVLRDEVGDRPPITIVFDGPLDRRVRDDRHVDVYIEGWLRGDALVATHVEAFNDHRYDPCWDGSCVEAQFR